VSHAQTDAPFEDLPSGLAVEGGLPAINQNAQALIASLFFWFSTKTAEHHTQ
jgi:hypothetical protein